MFYLIRINENCAYCDSQVLEKSKLVNFIPSNYNYAQARMWQSIHFHDEINNQAILKNKMESHTGTLALNFLK